MNKYIWIWLSMSILFVSAAKAADDWTQQYPSSKPADRWLHAMAYVGEDKVLLFGGRIGTLQKNDTWIYDISDSIWSQQNPAYKPDGTQAHAMAYIGGDQALLFGGYRGKGREDETWLYDLSDTTWIWKGPSSKPSERHHHAMAYISDNKVLMFGGRTTDYNGETWVYDLSTNIWSQIYPVASPTARSDHAMVYIGGDKVLFFGGENNSGSKDDTWVYDLSDNNWIQQNPSSKPSARIRHSIAYMGGDQVVLFGGSDGNYNYNDDTWVYDLSNDSWTQDTNTIQPSARECFGLSETSMDGSNHIVLFGGYTGGAYDDETWTFGDGDYLPVPDPPVVTVTYPNGGEVLCDSTTITWTAVDPDPGETALLLIDMDYSINAGTTWAAIDSNQANDGAYPWNISELPDGNDYLIRINVVDTTGFFDTDTSDAVFIIDNPDPPEVTVIYPNGGEILSESVEIAWNATDPDTGEIALLLLDLDYSVNARSLWTIIDSVQPNDGEYTWDISGLADGVSYLVQITVTDTTGLFDSDSSDGVFTIDINSPEPIDNLKAQLHSGAKSYGGNIYLSWSESFDGAGVHHYMVYRSESPQELGDSLAITADTTYLDEYVYAIGKPNLHYYYCVKAVDFSGNKSEDSNKVGEFDKVLRW